MEKSSLPGIKPGLKQKQVRLYDILIHYGLLQLLE